MSRELTRKLWFVHDAMAVVRPGVCPAVSRTVRRRGMLLGGVPSFLDALAVVALVALAGAVLGSAAPTRPNCVAKCPSPSTCSNVQGTPVCKCPMGQRFVYGKCSTGTLRWSAYLDPHNEARAAVGSRYLIWDSTVAADAQAFANKLRSQKCGLPRATEPPTGQGQNVANTPMMSWGNATSAVNMWVASGASYVYTKYNGQFGLYTQVIWNNTQNLGCATATCPAQNLQVFVCNYKTGGNIGNQFPYKK